MSKPRPTIGRRAIIDFCREIVDEYAAQDLRLTVRQIYYQCVTRDPATFPSSDGSYNAVKDAMAIARMEGSVHFSDIEDRGRRWATPIYRDARFDADAALEQAIDEVHGLRQSLLYVDRWFLQPVIPYVFVEKEALSGVFVKPCEEWHVGLLPCRGYLSLSMLYDWLIELEEIHWDCEVRILYFGDHDPDGLQIPVSLIERAEEIAYLEGLSPPKMKLDRIAITLDQVREYDCPPFWAKTTSARYQKYFRETGTDHAWELDALDPAVLRRLVSESVAPFWDNAIWQGLADKVNESRKDFDERFVNELRDLLDYG